MFSQYTFSNLDKQDKDEHLDAGWKNDPITKKNISTDTSFLLVFILGIFYFSNYETTNKRPMGHIAHLSHIG
jgi:hypothetical protein